MSVILEAFYYSEIKGKICIHKQTLLIYTTLVGSVNESGP